MIFIHIYSWKSFVKWNHTRRPVCKIWTRRHPAGWSGCGIPAAGPREKYWNTQHNPDRRSEWKLRLSRYSNAISPPISLYCFSSQVFILGFSCSLTLLCIKTHLVKATTLLRNQSHPWLLKMFSGLMSKSIHMLMRNFCFKILFKNVYEEELFTLIILRCKRSCFKKRKE